MSIILEYGVLEKTSVLLTGAWFSVLVTALCPMGRVIDTKWNNPLSSEGLFQQLTRHLGDSCLGGPCWSP